MNMKDAFASAKEYEAPDPWGAEPEPLKKDAPPAEPYPLDALGPVERAARAIIDITRVPPALAAQSVLAATTLAAQAHANVETLDGAKPLSLFMITVAESGERKSAADRRALDAVRDREAALRDAYEHERRQYHRALTVWHAEHKAIEKQLEKDPKNSAGRADLEALRPEPEPPLLPNLIAGDPTLEGLQRLFAEGGPSLGLFSDEGGAIPRRLQHERGPQVQDNFRPLPVLGWHAHRPDQGEGRGAGSGRKAASSTSDVAAGDRHRPVRR